MKLVKGDDPVRSLDISLHDMCQICSALLAGRACVTSACTMVAAGSEMSTLA